MYRFAMIYLKEKSVVGSCGIACDFYRIAERVSKLPLQLTFRRALDQWMPLVCRRQTAQFRFAKHAALPTGAK